LRGAAPVSVLLAGFKSYTPMVLYAVDEVGMVAGDARTPGRKRLIPGRASRSWGWIL